jgi:hypothetical protein
LIFLLIQILIRLSAYDSLMKVKQTERAMEDVAKRANPEYAVVPWGEYERRIVEAYGHASIQHVIGSLSL